MTAMRRGKGRAAAYSVLRRSTIEAPWRGGAQLPHTGRATPGCDVGPFEEAEPELERQDPPAGRVDERLRDQFALDRLLQRGKHRRTCSGRPRRRARAPAAAGRRRGAHQPVDREHVGHHDAVEAPLSRRSRSAGPARGARHAVDVVVGGHHAERARLDTGAGGRQVDLGELARPESAPRAVATADRGTLPGEVLEHHRDPAAACPRTSARVHQRGRAAGPRRSTPRTGPTAGRAACPAPDTSARCAPRARSSAAVCAAASSTRSGSQVAADGEVRRAGQLRSERLVAVRRLLDEQRRDAEPRRCDDVPLHRRREVGRVRRGRRRRPVAAGPRVGALEPVERAQPSHAGDLVVQRPVSRARPVRPYACQPSSRWLSCPTFSRSVMRASRSRTRSRTGAAGSRYSGSFIAVPGRARRTGPGRRP